MKKIIPIFIVGVLLCTAFGATALQSDVRNQQGSSQGNRDYTHTVFVEVGTAQWCPPCATWNTNIYNAYNSGLYDFEYVEMIYDDHDSNVLNNLAYSWMQLYNPTYIPASIFDGDFQRLEGNYPDQLPGALNTCGQRTVKNIDAGISVSWLGNATLSINIQITNHESTQYNGHIRVPIAEIISRYDTDSGTDYHHGFLDYAFPMNLAISIAPGATYTNSVTWVGSQHQDNHGTNFGDITAENIIVFLGVFNNQNNYVDETAAAIVGAVNTPTNPTPPDGATSVDVNVNLSWAGGPGTSITYDVYLGTTNPPPQVANNQSGTTYNPVTLNYQTTYYWKVVAWDTSGNTAEGPIWHFTTATNPNTPPLRPDLSGPEKVKPGMTYKYTITATDPDADWLYAYIVWGDDTTTDWIGPYNSGETFFINHQWDGKGTYTVKVKVKDEHSAESDWATLEVKVPIDRSIANPILSWLFERFPNAFPLLRYFLGV